MDIKHIIDKLEAENRLDKEEWIRLIKERDEETAEYLFKKARRIRERYYGKDVYIRGLIEFTNYCRNDCFYCGIRKGNRKAARYRLTKEEILVCCQEGYELGFRSFVLQGGEDSFFSAEKMADIITSIKERFSDCALTLSVGEHPKETYRLWYECGADRYLLRHESADEEHYARLHPPQMKLKSRLDCLEALKEIGFQTGCGGMVGSPYQTEECLAEDMMFISDFKPDMVGIGPFIPHADTPFADKAQGTLELTLYMLGLVRLTLPEVLLPATTALGTIDENGREKGLLAGANVCMPNLSPTSVRDKYMLYDNKLRSGEEAAENIKLLKERFGRIGFCIAAGRGDRHGISPR